MDPAAGWVDDGWDDEAELFEFRAPWHWRLRLWIRNDLARLRFWR